MLGLADPYLKTNRAKEHLDDLRERLRIFREDEPIRVTREDDVENQKYILRLKVKDVPEKFPLIVGDFLFCVRSSLDQLVWALAKITLPYPEGTQFPILDTRDPKRFERQTRGVPAGAVTIIESLQPYHGGDVAALRSHLLWRLNLLCNIDKHRRIPAHKIITNINFPDFPRELARLVEFDHDSGVVQVPLHLKSKMGFDPTGSINVTFGDSYEGIEREVAGLEAIYEFVANSVLPRFLSFF